MVSRIDTRGVSWVFGPCFWASVLVSVLLDAMSLGADSIGSGTKLAGHGMMGFGVFRIYGIGYFTACCKSGHS